MLGLLRDVLTGKRTLSERTRKLTAGSLTLLLAQATGMGAGLLVTILTARRLNPEEFGLWSILTDWPALFAAFDLGLSSALRNRLAELSASPEGDAPARERFLAAARLARNAAFLLSLAVLLLYPLLPWTKFLGVAPDVLKPAWPVACVLAFVAVIFQIVFGLASVGFMAYQETHFFGAFVILWNLLSVAVVGAVFAARGSFLLLVGTYFGGNLAILFVEYAAFLKRRGWGGRQGVAVMGTELIIRELGGASWKFGVLQASSAVMVFAASLAAGQTCGLAQAGIFSLAHKIFMILVAAQTLLLTPLWSAYTEAQASGDRAWVRSHLRRSVLFTSALFIGGGAFCVVVGPALIRWTTTKVLDDRGLLVSFAAWALVFGWSACFSTYLNAVGKLRRQAAIAAATAVSYFPLALWMGRTWGLRGVCWAGIIVVIPSALNNTLETLEEP